MLPQMNLLTVPLRMNSLQAVTASHLDCADPLPKEQDHHIVVVKQDIEQKTQENHTACPEVYSGRGRSPRVTTADVSFPNPDQAKPGLALKIM